MKTLIQRVSSASVRVNGKQIGKICSGLLVFVGIGQGDSPKDINYLVDKILNLRIFPDQNGKFNHSILDIKGDLLVISQFTLYADCRKGRRPSFEAALNPSDALPIYQQVVNEFKKSGLKVAVGEFQAMMEVELINDGPVTIFLESKS